VALRGKGIPQLQLAQLSARLALQEYVIRARKGQDAKRLLAGMGWDGRVEQFGIFELRRLSPVPPAI
jgi:hypothetical protein